jgi:prolyl-tRNA synthetase
LREAPADETSRNGQLLIRAGYAHKEMAGVYALLPLGLRVLEKIKNIIRREMNGLGGQEILLTNLQPRAIWETTTRWRDDVVDNWFKTKLKNDEEVGLAFSHEEPVLDLIQKFVHSYKDLPVDRPLAVYQFQTKLRNELRAKSGLLRGREFLMKDMYSFHRDADDLAEFYEKVAAAYQRIFAAVGLGDQTYKTFASGGSFTKFSHEFQTICEAGEDWLYLDRAKNIAVNEEVLDDAIRQFNLRKEDLEKVRSAEVGNIFNFGGDKARQMGIFYTDENGARQPLFLASYGIGVTRLLAVLAEIYSDQRGLKWPKTVAPFEVYLARLGDDAAVVSQADELYADLKRRGVEVLYDDLDARPGAKFADADLIGCPVRLVVSSKLASQKLIEYKPRALDVAENLTSDALFAKLITN